MHKLRHLRLTNRVNALGSALSLFKAIAFTAYVSFCSLQWRTSSAVLASRQCLWPCREKVVPLLVLFRPCSELLHPQLMSLCAGCRLLLRLCQHCCVTWRFCVHTWMLSAFSYRRRGLHARDYGTVRRSSSNCSVAYTATSCTHLLRLVLVSCSCTRLCLIAASFIRARWCSLHLSCLPIYGHCIVAVHCAPCDLAFGTTWVY